MLNITFTPNQTPLSDSRLTQSNAGSSQVNADGFAKQITNSTSNLIGFNDTIDKAQSLTVTIKAAVTSADFYTTGFRIDMYILYTDASNNVRFLPNRLGANNNDLRIIRTVGGSATSVTVAAGVADSYFVDGDVLTLGAAWSDLDADTVSDDVTLTFKKNGVTVGSAVTVNNFALTTGKPYYFLQSGPSGQSSLISNFQVTGEAADVTAPTFTVSPFAIATADTTATIGGTSTETGTVSVIPASSLPSDATFDAAASAIIAATPFSVNLTGLTAGALQPIYVQIKDSSGNRTTASPFNILLSHAGYSRVTIVTPNPIAAYRITTDGADLAAADIVDWGGIVGTGSVVVDNAGSPSGPSTVTAFTAYVGNLTDGWGIGRVQSIGAAETTLPTLASATVNTAGTQLTLALSETVSIGVGGNGGFTPTLSGGACTLTYSSGSGSSVLIYTTSRTIQSGETGTLAYVQPGDGVEDASGNDLASLSGLAITNNSTIDTVAPTLQLALIPKAGTTLVLAFSEAVKFGAGGNGGFALTMSGGAVTATYASGTTTTVLTYTLSRTVAAAETGTITYTQPGNGVEDIAGNDLASIGSTSVIRGGSGSNRFNSFNNFLLGF